MIDAERFLRDPRICSGCALAGVSPFTERMLRDPPGRARERRRLGAALAPIGVGVHRSAAATHARVHLDGEAARAADAAAALPTKSLLGYADGPSSWAPATDAPS